jgi:hypothetical protein
MPGRSARPKPGHHATCGRCPATRGSPHPVQPPGPTPRQDLRLLRLMVPTPQPLGGRDSGARRDWGGTVRVDPNYIRQHVTERFRRVVRPRSGPWVVLHDDEGSYREPDRDGRRYVTGRSGGWRDLCCPSPRVTDSLAMEGPTPWDSACSPTPVTTHRTNSRVSTGLDCDAAAGSWCDVESWASSDGEILVVRVSGERDMLTRPIVAATLAEAVSRAPRHLVVDLACGVPEPGHGL